MKPKLGYPQLWYRQFPWYIEEGTKIVSKQDSDSLRIIYPDGTVEVYMDEGPKSKWEPSALTANTQTEAMSNARMSDLEFICNLEE